jgi:hypothetical protein
VRTECWTRGLVHFAYAHLREVRLTIALGGLLSLLAWSVFILMNHPVAGAVDRGDFHRVAGPAGIEVSAPPRSASGRPLVRLTYPERSQPRTAATESAAWAAVVAKHLGPWGTEDHFDLRDLATVYLLLIALVFGVALHLRWPPELCLLLGWVVADAGYLIYFNSLYSEPPWLIGVLGLTLALGGYGNRAQGHDRHSASRRTLRAFVLLALMVFSGMSRLPACLTPLLVGGLLFLRWWTRGRAWKRRKVLFFMAAAAIVVLPPYHFSMGEGSRYREINSFHSVFVGVVDAADHPDMALKRLGLPSSYVKYKGRSFFEANPDRSVRREVAAISRVDLLSTYLAHPEAIVAVLHRVQRQLSIGVAVVDYETDRARPRHDVPWRFTRVRVAVLGAFPFAVWIVLFGACLLGVMGWTGGKVASPLSILFLALTVLCQIPITVLGDGLFGLGRHLLVARFALDCLLVLLAWEGGAMALTRLKIGDKVESGT